MTNSFDIESSHGRATVEQAEQLHGLVAEALLINLMQMREERAMRPATIAQALKFLHLTGVTSPAASRDKVDTLIACMPDFDDLENNGTEEMQRPR